ncbi:MAG: heme-copper oxidase subunit III [Candidatus Binatia bacterium]
MSQAAALEHTLPVEPAESPLTPESWGKLGMWVFLAGDAMSFGGLIAGYAALRFGDPEWPIPSTILGVPFTAVMTFLLICTSVTMVKSLESIKHGDRAGLRRFLGLTILGGACFLGMQAREWTHLIETGMTLTSKGLFGSTFFVLTGFHGCHVFSGVVYLSCIRANAARYSRDNCNPVEIAGLYWHFVDLVWILIFTFVYLI